MEINVRYNLPKTSELLIYKINLSVVKTYFCLFI